MKLLFPLLTPSPKVHTKAEHVEDCPQDAHKHAYDSLGQCAQYPTLDFRTMDIQSFLVGIGFGGVVSAWATHHFTVSRMAIADKNDFRGFLGRWIGAMKQMNGTDELQIRRIYFEHLSHLPGYAGKLDKVFMRRGRFRALCRNLGDMKADEIVNSKDKDCRTLVESRIQAVIDFV